MKSRSDLKALVTQKFPTNGANLIPASDARAFFNDIIDSVSNIVDDKIISIKEVDFEWADMQTVNGNGILTVNHNLHRYPKVWCVDNATGNELNIIVFHDKVNRDSFYVQFAEEFTGVYTINYL